MTNIKALPPVDLHERIQKEGLDATTLQPVLDGHVQYRQADIIELHKMMRKTPVHLLFMVNMFNHTQDYNDVVFKIAANILDPQKGTAVLGLGSMLTTSLPASREQIFSGLGTLQYKDFRPRDGMPEYTGILKRGVHRLGSDPLRVYQARQAPKLHLYRK